VDKYDALFTGVKSKQTAKPDKYDALFAGVKPKSKRKLTDNPTGMTISRAKPESLSEKIVNVFQSHTAGMPVSVKGARKGLKQSNEAIQGVAGKVSQVAGDISKKQFDRSLAGTIANRTLGKNNVLSKTARNTGEVVAGIVTSPVALPSGLVLDPVNTVKGLGQGVYENWRDPVKSIKEGKLPTLLSDVAMVAGLGAHGVKSIKARAKAKSAKPAPVTSPVTKAVVQNLVDEGVIKPEVAAREVPGLKNLAKKMDVADAKKIDDANLDSFLSRMDNELGEQVTSKGLAGRAPKGGDPVKKSVAKTETVITKQPANTTLYRGATSKNPGEGEWFSSDKRLAEKFAEGRAKQQKSEPVVSELNVDLSTKKMADLSFAGMDEMVIPEDVAKVTGIPLDDILKATYGENKPFAVMGLIDSPQFTEVLKTHGYDGIISKEGLSSPTDYVPTYKLFKTEQKPAPAAIAEVKQEFDATQGKPKPTAKKYDIGIGDEIYPHDPEGVGLPKLTVLDVRGDQARLEIEGDGIMKAPIEKLYEKGTVVSVDEIAAAEADMIRASTDSYNREMLGALDPYISDSVGKGNATAKLIRTYKTKTGKSVTKPVKANLASYGISEIAAQMNLSPESFVDMASERIRANGGEFKIKTPTSTRSVGELFDTITAYELKLLKESYKPGKSEVIPSGGSADSDFAPPTLEPVDAGTYTKPYNATKNAFSNSTIKGKEGQRAVEGGIFGEAQKDIFSEIAARTNEAIPEEQLPTPGLTMQYVGGGKPSDVRVPTKMYVSPDTAIEQGFRDTAGGVKGDGFVQHVKEGLTNLFHSMTRTYADLPRSPEFATANDKLRYLGHQKGVASNKTLQILQDITLPLKDTNAFDIFRRRVVLDDLVATANRGEKLPFGWTPEQVKAEAARIDAALAGKPDINEALMRRMDAWEAVKSDYIQAQKDMGFDVSKMLTREDYFRHQVLDYMNTGGVKGTGKKLKTPTSRGFLKEREGSSKAISTNYLQAEWEVMAQMIHDTEVSRVLKTLEKEYDISGKIKPGEPIPDGYTVWQPREGNTFYMAKTIPETVVTGLLDEIGFDTLPMNEVLALGGKRKQWIIPEALAKTLDNIGSKRVDPARKTLNARLLNLWKQYVLLNPKRLVKYNLRNLSGDAEMLFVGNPSAFKEVPSAVKELYQTHKTSRAPEGDLADWVQRGGQQGLLQAQEMGQLDQLAAFIRLSEKKPGLKTSITGLPRKYWEGARLSTDFREGILRYAAYKDYLKQVMSNPEGKPKNFGASIPEEVMAIKDLKDRAYKLSNELLGAYDQISETGRGLREGVYPFWSWVEVNFGRNIRLMKNAAREGNVGGTLTRKIAVGAPKTVYSGAKLALKASAMWTMLQVYNNLRFPDEERDLPPEVRSRPHIIFGRSSDGTIKYLSRLGAVSDFLEWFGLDAPQQKVTDFLNGRVTAKDLAKEAVQKPVNKMAQGLNPIWKIGTELATGKTLYPNVFEPGKLRDKADYLAKQVSVENEFREATGRPNEPYGKSLMRGFIDTADPVQTAYYEILDKKYTFLEERGKPGGESANSPKSQALYYYKRAKALGDTKAEQKYKKQYMELGGTKQGIAQSVRTGEPLYGLGKSKNEFLKSLTAEDKRKLKLANQYYKKISKGVPKGSSAIPSMPSTPSMSPKIPGAPY
jgi:hypothetical protein